MESQKKNNSSTIYISIIVLLTVVIAWLVYDKFNTATETEVLITSLENSNSEKDSISTEFRELYNDYEQLKTTNDTINIKLAGEQKKIEQLMADLKRTKSSNKQQIDEYKKELETLRSIMRSFIVQIDSLNTKNQQLIAENKTIKTSLETVVNENSQLLTVTDSLSNTIKTAKSLKAVGVVANAINERGKPTNRITKISKIEVCFSLPENSITNKGIRPIYIRIARPDGNILLNESSGLFTFDKKEIAYSSSKSENYLGKILNTCIYFNTREALPAGKYTVDVFFDGFKIGYSEFVLQ